MRLNILYRGPLSSCNYGCEYCPFAKKTETRTELERDRAALERFVDVIAARSSRRFGILFTPWGEALIRSWYRDALVRLTNLDHVDRAVVQTNLSCDVAWVERCRLDRLALWTTFHPTEVPLANFLAKVRSLVERGVRLSVGVVGLREHFGDISQLRAQLPTDVYLWVNAYKRMPSYYSVADVDFLAGVDRHFPVNNVHHASLGLDCVAGEESFTIDGEGVMRRCHFVGEPIGDWYSPDWEAALQPRTCPRDACSCHIGYVNLTRLGLDRVYGESILERIPLPDF